RYAFDFADHPDRLSKPLIRQADDSFATATWEQALDFAAAKLKEVRDTKGPGAIGVIGSNRITNEENYVLQKFARTVLSTNNIDHHRTADYVSFVRAVAGHPERAASLRDASTAPAILLLGNDPTEQHPALAWALRTNVRLNKARLYVVNANRIKLRRQAKAFLHIPENSYADAVRFLASTDGDFNGIEGAAEFRGALRAEPNLLIAFGSEFRGHDIDALISFGLSLPETRFACLADYANSRGAADMGVLPDLLPGYRPVSAPGPFAEEYPSLPQTPGKDLIEMFDAAERGELGALYVVGSNPVARYNIDPASLKNTFLIVQDMFLTESAQLADLVLPTANLYEKGGTVTNNYGDLQLVKKAGDRAGVRTDLELIVRLADRMGADPHKLVPFGRGLRADTGQSRGAQSGEADRHAIWLASRQIEPKLSPFDPYAVLDEIERLVPGYDVERMNLLAANDVRTRLVSIGPAPNPRRDLVLPAQDALFTSGTLGRYCEKLQEVHEQHRKSPAEAAAD
ncbi:MAG TPA: molybdopterin-dependent oxidoreductase, partial [Acidobacteriaceae bacterium]